MTTSIGNEGGERASNTRGKCRKKGACPSHLSLRKEGRIHFSPAKKKVGVRSSLALPSAKGGLSTGQGAASALARLGDQGDDHLYSRRRLERDASPSALEKEKEGGRCGDARGLCLISAPTEKKEEGGLANLLKREERGMPPLRLPAQRGPGPLSANSTSRGRIGIVWAKGEGKRK